MVYWKLLFSTIPLYKKVMSFTTYWTLTVRLVDGFHQGLGRRQIPRNIATFLSIFFLPDRPVNFPLSPAFYLSEIVFSHIKMPDTYFPLTAIPPRRYLTFQKRLTAIRRRLLLEYLHISRTFRCKIWIIRYYKRNKKYFSLNK